MTYGVLADSREVFGGPLTQITLLATQQTKEKNPTLFKAVANALDESIRVANADKRAAAILWKKAQNAPESASNAQSLAKGLLLCNLTCYSLSLILPASPSRQLQSSYTARRVGARSAALTLELGHHQMRLFGILVRPEKI